jgi:signal transduction histidine kinase
MLRRLLPTFLGLTSGLVALAWGLFSLHSIFAQERADAQSQLRASQEAVRGYASKALAEALSKDLSTHLPKLQEALEDSLVPADDYFVRFQEHQFLPRLGGAKPGTKTPAKDTYESLTHAGSANAIEPILRRRLEAFLHRSPNAARAMESLLGLEAANALPPEQDLAFKVFMLERLQEHPESLALIRSLWNGLAHTGGLQRDVLANRHRLTRGDFDFLKGHVIQLSHALAEPTDAFEARAQETGAGELVLPSQLVEPTLIGGAWYVEPSGGGFRGVRVDTRETLRGIAASMREHKLLDVDASLSLGPAATQGASAFDVAVSVPRLARVREEIEQRYRLKSVLLAVCGTLALIIFGLAVLAQQRKDRFVELKSQFVASVSHELRTPIASMRLLAETLENKLHGSPEARDYPRRIVDAADSLTLVVDNILSFNRLTKGRWQPELRRLRLDEVASTLEKELKTFTEVPVRLSVNVQDVELDGEPALLRLLLANLGRNACRYNRRNPVEISIEAREHMKGASGYTVAFSDNGVGIPEEAWDEVFEDFVRFKHPGLETPGSGLGLALCKRIMRAHGGDIQIAGSSAQGTTFALRFPSPRT